VLAKRMKPSRIGYPIRPPSMWELFTPVNLDIPFNAFTAPAISARWLVRNVHRRKVLEKGKLICTLSCKTQLNSTTRFTILDTQFKQHTKGGNQTISSKTIPTRSPKSPHPMQITQTIKTQITRRVQEHLHWGSFRYRIEDGHVKAVHKPRPCKIGTRRLLRTTFFRTSIAANKVQTLAHPQETIPTFFRQVREQINYSSPWLPKRTRLTSVDFRGLPVYLWPVILDQSSWISFRVRTRCSFGSFNGGGAGSSLATRWATRLDRFVAPLLLLVGTALVPAGTASLPRFLHPFSHLFATLITTSHYLGC
jgi:hypothetical protein